MGFIGILLTLVNIGLATGVSLNPFQDQKLPQKFTYSCPDEIKDRVKTAFDQWNSVCDNTFTYDKVDSNADVTFTMNELPAPYQGMTYPFGNKAIIQLKPEGLSNDLLIPHEIGHAFGLSHSMDPQSLMFPHGVFLSHGITQSDINSIRDRYGLSPRTFSFKHQVKGRTFIGIGFTKKAHWITAEKLNIFKQRLVMPEPSGTYTFCLIDSGLALYQTVQIQGKKKLSNAENTCSDDCSR